MTTIAKLLGRKQRLLERLQENPSPHERNETVRLLMQIETALRLGRGNWASANGTNRVCP